MAAATVRSTSSKAQAGKAIYSMGAFWMSGVREAKATREFEGDRTRSIWVEWLGEGKNTGRSEPDWRTVLL